MKIETQLNRRYTQQWRGQECLVYAKSQGISPEVTYWQKGVVVYLFAEYCDTSRLGPSATVILNTGGVVTVPLHNVIVEDDSESHQSP